MPHAASAHSAARTIVRVLIASVYSVRRVRRRIYDFDVFCTRRRNDDSGRDRSENNRRNFHGMWIGISGKTVEKALDLGRSDRIDEILTHKPRRYFDAALPAAGFC